MEWNLRIAMLQIFLFDDVLQYIKIPTARKSFGNRLQRRVGEVEMKRTVADELPYLTTQLGKKSFGDFTLHCRGFLHLRAKVKVIHVERDLAVPSWGQCRASIVRQLTNPSVKQCE